MTSKVVLVGHSAAGKSSVVAALGFDPAVFDMDETWVAGTPPVGWVRSWVVSRPPGVVALGNHGDTLAELAAIKGAGTPDPLFVGVVWAYLLKSKDELRGHLILPTAAGVTRPDRDVGLTLDSYDYMDGLYRALADRVIRCDGKPITDVANLVREL